MNLYAWPRYEKNISDALQDFCKGDTFNHWNLGNLYDEVPGQYARKLGVEYGAFVSTGTAGLHCALMALGLDRGDEVIVPSMTFIRAVTPLVHLGLQPVLADVDPNTGNLDPEAIERCITSKTRAVVVVHMWGVPADLDLIRSVCDKYSLKLIEDFSHAHFSKYKNRYVGSYGDVSFASLQRKKTLSIGEGGLVVTNNLEVYKRLLEITHPGSFTNEKDYRNVDFSGFGLNMRLSPFSAVVARELYSEIDKIVGERGETVRILEGLLEESELFELHRKNGAEGISWYSYKPKFFGEKSKLAQLKLWKFSDALYPDIASHLFWSKDVNFFPFSQRIVPRVVCDLMGHKKYLKDRYSLSIPTVPLEYWTSERIQEWRKDLLILSEGS